MRATRVGWAVGLGAGLMLAMSGAARAGSEYKLVDLGVLDGGQSSGGYALNSVGHATGTADVGGSGQVFLSDGQPPMHQVAVPGSGTGFGINDKGQIAGRTLASNGHGGLATRGFVTGEDAGSAHLLTGLAGGLDYSAARGLNDSGVIVGSGMTASGMLRAVMWDGPNAAARDLGTLKGGLQSQAMAINDAGVMVGWSDSNFVTRAVEFRFDGTGTTIKDLGSLDGSGASKAMGINAGGQVVGSSSAPGGSTHAFLYDDRNTVTPMMDLQAGSHLWDGWSSEAHGINGAGWAVGQLYRGANGSQQVAFLWVPGRGMVSLADLVDPGEAAGWTFSNAWGINDRDQIVGVGSYQGYTRAFLLNPTEVVVPEPASAALLGLGLLALAGRSWARRRAG